MQVRPDWLAEGRENKSGTASRLPEELFSPPLLPS